MKIFSSLYDKTLRWSRHPKAPWYLGGLSFAESSFFPIPPDVMLAPMTLARPERAVFLATLTTVTSVLGGVLGYLIGMFAFELVEPVIVSMNYEDKYKLVNAWFEEYGFWAVFIAGFSPVPYKLFTIASGVIAMPFLPFVLASVVGRGGRFFLVALLIKAGGEKMEQQLRRYVDWIGWILVVLIIIAVIVAKL